MKKIMFAGTMLATLLAAAPAFAAVVPASGNLLKNGSFENGFQDWTVTNTGSGQGYSDPVVITYNQNNAYPNGAFGEAVPTDNATGNPGFDAVGSKFLYLSTDVGTNVLSQTVNLVAGTTYRFGFDYYLPANGYGNANDATFTASVGGDQFASFTLGSQAATTWATLSQTKTFTSTKSGQFTLSFAGTRFAAKDVAIDRVFLSTVAAVPEPSTWALMLAGFGMVGFAMRRRKTTATLRLA